MQNPLSSLYLTFATGQPRGQRSVTHSPAMWFYMAGVTSPVVTGLTVEGGDSPPKQGNTTSSVSGPSPPLSLGWNLRPLGPPGFGPLRLRDSRPLCFEPQGPFMSSRAAAW